MNLDTLNTFILLSETGSFSEVARKSNLTQSTVSARIKVLEERLKTQLFTRTPSGVVLTEAGEKFYRYALPMRQLWQQGCKEVSQPETHEGSIGLGLHLTMWRRFIPEWMIWMRARWPNLAVRVEADYSEKLLDYLVRGVLDLAITHMPIGSPTLEIEPFMSDDLILVSRVPRDFGTCQGKKYIYVDWSYGYREEHQQKLPDFGRSNMNIGHGDIALQYLLVSDCYCYMPRTYVQTHLELQQLFIVADSPVLSRPSYLVYPKTPVDKIALQSAIEGLRASLQPVEIQAFKPVN